MSSNEDKISHFNDICGTGETQARFFLEAAGWDLDSAVEEFFNSNDNGSNAGTAEAGTDAAPPPPEKLDSRPKPSGSRFVSMSNFRSKDDSDSDEEEGQAFYVGGSEKGAGQQVLGPPRKKTGDIVKQMFESAREHGAVAPEDEPASSTGAQGSSSFTGTGYRLGDSVSAPSEMVAGAPRLQRRAPPVDRVLKLWRDGFSVDDGPLRSYHNAEQEFLSAVQRGEIPDELLKDAKGGEVNLNMEDHRHEAFVAPPKVRLVPFSGVGHTLGSPAPNVVMGTSTTVTPAGPAVERVKVDGSQPATRIQVRLEDGSRLVLNLNLTHTVADIRQEIVSQRPQYSIDGFLLMTTFPNRELTDDSQTIDSAKLQNAAIAMRLKR